MGKHDLHHGVVRFFRLLVPADVEFQETELLHVVICQPLVFSVAIGKATVVRRAVTAQNYPLFLPVL